jgi:enoyl-CoA hydratase/carnithine racemase
MFARITSGVRIEDEIARLAIVEALESADHIEGLNAFLERRQAKFSD